jgi:TPP-dependent trihydroxycyclohexane-1,2-dione (THcHDO) dehydratase
MTHGYASWWRVGNAEVSKSKLVNEQYKKNLIIKNKLKGY